MTTPALLALTAGRCARCPRRSAPLGFIARLAPLRPHPALLGASVQPWALSTLPRARRAAAGPSALPAQRPARRARRGQCSPLLRARARPRQCVGLRARAARCSSPAPLPPLPASPLPPTGLPPLARSALPMPWGPAVPPRPPASSALPAWARGAAPSQQPTSSLATPVAALASSWQCRCSAPCCRASAPCAPLGPLPPAAPLPARSARRTFTPLLRGALACRARAALSPPPTGSPAAAQAPRGQ
jgi:hypothetical protein